MKTKSLSALLTAALLLGTLTGCGQAGDDDGLLHWMPPRHVRVEAGLVYPG